jgi:hypothetical protein
VASSQGGGANGGLTAEHGGAPAISGDGKPRQARLHLYEYLGRSRVRIGACGGASEAWPRAWQHSGVSMTAALWRSALARPALALSFCHDLDLALT